MWIPYLAWTSPGLQIEYLARRVEHSFVPLSDTIF